MSDQEEMLYKAHTDAQSAGRTFLLGICASAVAFAFHETSDRKLTVSLVIIGFAVIVWGLSFTVGIRSAFFHRRAMANNLRWISMKRLAKGLPENFVGKSVEDAFKDIAKANTSERDHNRWMEIGLAIGALLYMIGHVLHLLGR